MRTLQKLILTVLLAASVAGCGARKAVVIDSGADWVKLGPDVSGHVYVYDAARSAWTLSPNKVTLPEGWVAGPEPKEK